MQTVGIPAIRANVLVPVEIPTIFCAQVDNPNVAPKAKHPDSTGANSSRMTESTFDVSILFLLVERERALAEQTGKVRISRKVRLNKRQKFLFRISSGEK